MKKEDILKILKTGSDYFYDIDEALTTFVNNYSENDGNSSKIYLL